MSDQFVSRGQPERSVALLWRAEPRPGRGPKRGLTIDAIAVRAIELADTEGLAGLSMRQLADALGVRPMTLYTYLPAKAELLDVMLDAVYGEIVSALEHSTEARSGNRAWRARLESRARADWALYRRHPWALRLARPRYLLGPNELAAPFLARRRCSTLSEREQASR